MVKYSSPKTGSSEDKAEKIRDDKISRIVARAEQIASERYRNLKELCSLDVFRAAYEVEHRLTSDESYGRAVVTLRKFNKSGELGQYVRVLGRRNLVKLDLKVDLAQVVCDYVASHRVNGGREYSNRRDADGEVCVSGIAKKRGSVKSAFDGRRLRRGEGLTGILGRRRLARPSKIKGLGNEYHGFVKSMAKQFYEEGRGDLTPTAAEVYLDLVGTNRVAKLIADNVRSKMVRKEAITAKGAVLNRTVLEEEVAPLLEDMLFPCLNKMRDIHRTRLAESYHLRGESKDESVESEAEDIDSRIGDILEEIEELTERVGVGRRLKVAKEELRKLRGEVVGEIETVEVESDALPREEKFIPEGVEEEP